jgi:hypothetical protein
MRIKRVPLLGAIGIILIIILLATTIGMYIHFEKNMQNFHQQMSHYVQL